MCLYKAKIKIQYFGNVYEIRTFFVNIDCKANKANEYLQDLLMNNIFIDDDNVYKITILEYEIVTKKE